MRVMSLLKVLNTFYEMRYGVKKEDMGEVFPE